MFSIIYFTQLEPNTLIHLQKQAKIIDYGSTYNHSEFGPYIESFISPPS